MNIQLKSDFIEPYDHWFDREGIVFERMSRNNISRSDMFKILTDAELRVPPHGSVEELYAVLPDTTHVVIYEDMYAHRGEGKHLLTVDKAIEDFPHKYCSVLVPMHFGLPVSTRYLRIGNKTHWLKYTSNDHWRSNCGLNVTIETYEPEFEDLKTVEETLGIVHPMFAIDFVQSIQNGFWYAIDFNTSPGIKGAPLEDSGKEIVELIKQWYEESDLFL